MNSFQPLGSAFNNERGWSRATGAAGFNLLLVSRSATWSEAVRCAAIELGGGDVRTCDARAALTRLAGTGEHYSHLLVDREDAEGLFDELAWLATEVAAPDTDIRTPTCWCWDPPRRGIRVFAVCPPPRHDQSSKR